MLAMQCGFGLEEAKAALDELCQFDPESQHANQPTVEVVPGGFRLTAFEDFHPNAVKRQEAILAARAEAGRKGGLSTQRKNREARGTDDEGVI